MLSTPAPFVFGGSFSDFKKEGRKFRRFSTLASLSRAVNDDKIEEEIPTREDEIKTLYTAAREEDIGTVSRIEMPEAVVSILNLVDIARYVQQSMGLPVPEDSEEADEEEEYADDYDYDECEDEEEELEGEVSESASTSADIKAALEVPRPVVFEGSFLDYQKDASKFMRFKTLGGFSRMVASESIESEESSTPSMASRETTAGSEISPASLYSQGITSTCSEDAAVDEGEPEQPNVVDGIIPVGSYSCQLLALSTPPSMEGDRTVYTSLSDAIVFRMIGSTMAGAKAATKRAVAKIAEALGEPELERVPGSLGRSNDDVPSASSSTAKDTLICSSPTKKANRFLFAEEDLKYLDSLGTKAFQMQKNGLGNKFHDDGSSWIVDGAAPLGGHRHRRAPHLSGSGSAWGGGGATLEPICSGKFSCDQPIKFTLPASMRT